MYETEICGLKVGDRIPPHVMGILNLSPESFFKDSVKNPENILEAAHKMIDEGATMIDIGARSTSPGVSEISESIERERLFSALDILDGNIDAVISVDTMNAEIAEGAISRGAGIINDQSGLTADPLMAKTIAENDAAVVLMATEKTRGDPLGMDAVKAALSKNISTAVDSGINPKKIILDPAVGHWIPEKTAEFDFEVIDRFEEFEIFEMPLMVAISRKSFLGGIVGKPASERLNATLAATALAVYKGGRIIRTHDVAETVDAAKTAFAMKKRFY